jgi:hypothetical protein
MYLVKKCGYLLYLVHNDGISLPVRNVFRKSLWIGRKPVEYARFQKRRLGQRRGVYEFTELGLVLKNDVFCLHACDGVQCFNERVALAVWSHKL